MSTLYMVTRSWNCDLDRKAPAVWYTMFISLNIEKARQYMNQVYLEEFIKVYLCEVPIDINLEIIDWEQYVIEKRENVPERTPYYRY